MERTRELVYFQEDNEVEEALKILEEQGQQALLDYLLNCGKKSPYEPSDSFKGDNESPKFQLGKYIVYWNKDFGYMGLVEIYND